MSADETKMVGSGGTTPPGGWSLKFVLLSIVSCLAIIIVVALGYQSAVSWQKHTAAQSLDRTNAASNRLVAGVFEILLERLATNNALLADAPADAETRKEIATRRSAVESGFASGLPAILEQNLPNKATLAQELKSATDKARDLRQRADEMLALPRAQRDEQVLKNYAPTMTGMVNAALKVWAGALYTTSSGDPVIARYARIKQLGWILREVSGLERATIATAIAGAKPIPAEGLQQIAGYRAQVALAWRLTQDLVVDDPLISAAMAAAKERYFDGFEPLADKMRKLSQEGAAYPMKAGEWVAVTNPQIDSLLGIMYAAGKASEDVTSRVETAALYELISQLVGIAVGLSVAALCFVVVIRRATTPLGRIAGVVVRMTAGDLDITVEDAGRRDEIGAVARAIEIFRENAIAARRLEAEQKAEQVRKEQRQATIEQHIRTFENGVRASLEVLASAATEMRATSQSMSATAEETSAQATTVAAAAEQASANVQTVATASEELSSSVVEIGRQVSQSTEIAGQAVGEASRSNATVQGLSEAAQKIGNVVKLISDIASQTNLLALNATIEAARAGEAGKGFAVVASEVKSLANQTAKATEEISAQIAAMQGATSGVVQTIQSIGGIIGTINEITTTIASAVEEQGAATQEISRNAQEAAKGTGQVSSAIGGLNQAAAATGTAADQVLTSAEELGKQAETLRADVGSFLAKIRAA